MTDWINLNADSTSWLSDVSLYVLDGYVDPDYVDGSTTDDTDWTNVAASQTTWL